MKRIALILVVLITQAVWAQDWARTQLAKSPRHQEWVTVKHDGRSVETFVVYPESKDKRPVVVLIHEIFGMSDWVQDLADQVAAAGYIAVAPDLLSPITPTNFLRPMASCLWQASAGAADRLFALPPIVPIWRRLLFSTARRPIKMP